MSKRVLIVSNPAAGQRGGRFLCRVLDTLAASGARTTHIKTQSAGELEQIIEGISPGEWDCIVVAGGDGSLMEAVNGAGAAWPPIGLIPIGTANVVSLEMALPSRPEEIADVILQGHTEEISTPEVNGRRFVFTAGAGFDAYLVAIVSCVLKKHTGKFAFVIAAFKALKHYKFPQIKIVVDGKIFYGVGVIIMHGSLYAGHYKVAPEQRLNDQTFSVIVLRKPGVCAAISYMLSMYRGRLSLHDEVTYIPSAECVNVSGPEGTVYQMDGDHAGQLPMHVCADAARVRLVVP